MTLRVYSDLVQGTEDWLAARRGIVTASVVGQLITPKTIKPANNDYSRALTMLLVAERITGHSDPVYVTADMERGNLDEPIARNLYRQHYNAVEEVGFMVREEDGWRLGFSPDGLIGEDGILEIKSRRPKKQLATILADEVPLENMAQLQAGMLVSGREWCDYVSFCGGMPLYVKRVYWDAQWNDTIIDAVREFERNAAEMVARYEGVTAHMFATERPNYDLEGMVL